MIYRYYILISYVESTDEIRRLILKLYNKKVIKFIFFPGPSLHHGDALASSCVFRHMNVCRVFHNINSTTYSQSSREEGVFDEN